MRSMSWAEDLAENSEE